MICRTCGEPLAIGSWPFCASKTNPGGHGVPTRQNAQMSDADAIVLWEHPTKGVRWPGRNDAPVPHYYASEGFVRKEYKRGIADVRALEKQHGVVSEVGNYDRSGHADSE